ncbi:TRAP-type C4-dicarboxylate transport system substrate-binding protein [Palleronia aestuarii]|uniref:TRAP-type C4-dicarboxylate transport system substrate-binding protein n=1 Tax=Palleronia aestuarii TaxID=568105 RepID=A0A2W7MYZ4_9RHOB|nr:TRAP transporter substrate-binding protein DctP [Palleronia aestuarii]PZX13040.1 TRAP-type C4-dicarboxylate transport system substrate-binding protein [Palleronia aestuarii]
MRILEYLMCAGALIATQATAEPVSLRLSEHFPPTHVGSQSGAQHFMQRVEEIAPGKIEFEHYPGEQLAKAAGQLDAVSKGLVDMAVVGLVYVTEKVPLSTAVELPGLFSDATVGARAFWKLAQNDLLEKEYKPLGVRPLFTFVVTPYQLMITSDQEINDLSQIEGLKLRVAGATGELIASSLGAVGVKISPTDLYLALERGVVDGAISNPASQVTYKTDALLNSWTTNASLGNVAFGLFVNERRWQELPEDVKQALLKAGEETGVNVAQKYTDGDKETFAKLRDEGKTVYELTSEMLSQMDDRLQAVRENWLKQMTERGLDGEEVLANFRAYVEEERAE